MTGSGSGSITGCKTRFVQGQSKLNANQALAKEEVAQWRPFRAAKPSRLALPCLTVAHRAEGLHVHSSRLSTGCVRLVIGVGYRDVVKAVSSLEGGWLVTGHLGECRASYRPRSYTDMLGTPRLALVVLHIC
jgi:hypothetical protein